MADKCAECSRLIQGQAYHYGPGVTVCSKKCRLRSAKRQKRGKGRA